MNILLFFALICLSLGTVYFSEDFSSGWESRWVHSKWLTVQKFTASPGWYYSDENDLGLQSNVPHKRYAISARFPEFSNTNKPLVIQYTLKLQQSVDCIGGYIKLLSDKFKQEKFNYQTRHKLVFGPDFCHDYEGGFFGVTDIKNITYSINEKLPIKNIKDGLTHQFTLIIHPDNSFQYLIDNEEKLASNFFDCFGKDFQYEYADARQFEFGKIGGVGIEVYQHTGGSLFDNIFISDDPQEALEFSIKTFVEKKEAEIKAKKEYDNSLEQKRAEFNKVNNVTDVIDLGENPDFTNFK